MPLRTISVLLSIVPVIIAFILLWNHRGKFRSMTPFIFGAVFLLIARLLDVPREVPALNILPHFGLRGESMDSYLTIAGDLADTIGLVFLILGFLQTWLFIEAEEKKIKDLETLLPLCAGCKKYRTDKGQWMPIEHYLVESGAPTLTHGICPDCASKIREQLHAGAPGEAADEGTRRPAQTRTS